MNEHRAMNDWNVLIATVNLMTNTMFPGQNKYVFQALAPTGRRMPTCQTIETEETYVIDLLQGMQYHSSTPTRKPTHTFELHKKRME